MICSIHQPNFFPWLGYFDKIARSDVFVFLNQVDYEKSGHSMQCYTNRVAIRDNKNEKKYIHCPVVREHGPQRIDTVIIKSDIDWKSEIFNSLMEGYECAPYRKESFELLEEIFNTKTQFLSEFNIRAIKTILDSLGIGTRLVRQDELNTSYHSTELLAEITSKVGCDRYLYGGGGHKYQQQEYFDKWGIIAVSQNFTSPEYMQGSDACFVGGLSILDALFWLGIDATGKMIVNH